MPGYNLGMDRKYNSADLARFVTVGTISFALIGTEVLCASVLIDAPQIFIGFVCSYIFGFTVLGIVLLVNRATVKAPPDPP
jgi:hypothetical protein